MNTHIKNSLFFYLLLLSAVSSYSQDFRLAADEARKAYGTLDRLHVIMKINVYDSKGAGKPSISQTADIKKDGYNYRYHVGSNDMLMNEKYLVLVNGDVKDISVSKRNLKAEKEFDDPVKMNFDSLVKHYDKVNYLGRKNDVDQYELIRTKGDLVSTGFFFDIKTKLLRKIEYHYKEGQLVVIEFRVFDQQPVFTKDTFSETDYLIASGGKWTPAERFVGFNISDLTGTNKK
jgi:outer membrane lipoprotein-sorting protein